MAKPPKLNQKNMKLFKLQKLSLCPEVRTQELEAFIKGSNVENSQA